MLLLLGMLFSSSTNPFWQNHCFRREDPCSTKRYVLWMSVAAEMRIPAKMMVWMKEKRNEKKKNKIKNVVMPLKIISATTHSGEELALVLRSKGFHPLAIHC